MLHISAFYSCHSIIPNGNSLGTILIDLFINFTYCRTVSSHHLVTLAELVSELLLPMLKSTDGSSL